MAVEYKCTPVEVNFLHVVPADFDAFPYYDEVNRVYLACQQFYKGSTADVGSLTKEQEESILADYKKFCEESLFVGDQYSGVPTFFGGEHGEIRYTPENIDDFVEFKTNQSNRIQFCKYLTMCKYIKDHLFSTAPLEHASLTIKATDVSRGFCTLWERNRIKIGSIKEPVLTSDIINGDCTVMLPYKLYDNAEAKAIAKTYFDQLPTVVDKIVKTGVSLSDAQCILPNALRTSMITTLNFREWMSTFKFFLNHDTSREMIDVVSSVWSHLNEDIPFIWADCWKREIKKSK